MNGIRVKLIKQTNGNIDVYSENGAFIESRPATGAIITVRNGNVHIIQQSERWLTLEPENVVSTQVLPDAAINFNSDATALATLLRSDFFFDLDQSKLSIIDRVYPLNAQAFFDPDGLTGTSLAANTIISRMIRVDGPVDINQLIARYSAATPLGNAVMGIYDIGSNGYPNNLLGVSAAISTNDTAAQPSPISGGVSLQAGYYALSYNASLSATLFCSPAASVMPNFGYSSTVLAVGNFTTYNAAHVYDGTLPAVHPAGTVGTGNAPFIICNLI